VQEAEVTCDLDGAAGNGHVLSVQTGRSLGDMRAYPLAAFEPPFDRPPCSLAKL